MDLKNVEIKPSYSITSGDFIGIVCDITGIEWNDACDLVAKNSIHGEDGAGYYTLFPDSCENDEKLKTVIDILFAFNPDAETISILDDF